MLPRRTAPGHELFIVLWRIDADRGVFHQLDRQRVPTFEHAKLFELLDLLEHARFPRGELEKKRPTVGVYAQVQPPIVAPASGR